jgi:D-alanine-D-alanine ligase
MSGVFRGKRVAVVYGGRSSERDVSVETGTAVISALESLGYDLVPIDAGRDLAARLRATGVAVVFNALHGTFGEDGRLQGMLDWMGIPYTGEGIRSSLLAFDKALAKRAYREAGVPVADDVIWSPEEAITKSADDLPFGLPVAVKPVAQGSSVGVTLVHRAEALPPALAKAATGPVMVEVLVEGPELSVVCLGDDALGCVEIEPLRDFYDYEAKYGGAGTRYHIPPRLPAAQIAAVETVGLAAHRALDCGGVTRSDVIVGHDGPVVLETNTLPGMTAASLVPKVAAAQGTDFPTLIERVLDLASHGPGSQGGRHGA